LEKHFVLRKISPPLREGRESGYLVTVKFPATSLNPSSRMEAGYPSENQ
jgi:hypothetical protein